MAYDPKSRVPYWSQITMDSDLCHGAVRTWFYLFNVRRNRENGLAFPEIRRIAKDIGAKTHSLAGPNGWIEQLKKAGYLVVGTRGQRHCFQYTFPGFALPNEATREIPDAPSRVAPSGMSRCPKGQHLALPQGATEPYSKEPKPMKEVSDTPRVLFELPKFEPLPKTIFLKEARDMRKWLQEQIDVIKGDPQATETVETRTAAGTPYKTKRLKPEAAKCVNAFADRMREVSLKAHGVKYTAAD